MSIDKLLAEIREKAELHKRLSAKYDLVITVYVQPQTILALLDVVRAATAYNVDLCVFSESGCGQCSQCLLHAAFKKLEAIDD